MEGVLLWSCQLPMEGVHCREWGLGGGKGGGSNNFATQSANAGAFQARRKMVRKCASLGFITDLKKAPMFGREGR